MARTTVDIDGPILKEIKALQKKERLPLGKIISRLLADALTRRRGREPEATLQWASSAMGARVDLEDKEAVHAVLDRRER
jgi:hypothetical protein